MSRSGGRSRSLRAGPAIVALAAALAGAGCSGGGASGPGEAPLAEPEGEATAQITVRQVLAEHSVLPTEGSVGFYRVNTSQLPEPLEARSLPTVRRAEVLSREVPAGTYVIESFQRNCNANCGNLGEPVDACEREVEVADGESVTATVRISHGQPCRISLS